jgi:hypothetical protein
MIYDPVLLVLCAAFVKCVSWAIAIVIIRP